MLDYMDKLKLLKQKIEEENISIEVDTQTFTEDLNAKLTKESKNYRESNKRIFKQYISYQNSQKILHLVSDIENYNISNIRDYKNEIINECNIIEAMGENPVEILVYSIKGLYGKTIFINAIRDIVKTIAEYNNENVKLAYKNILSNWNWNDCIEFVLKSICEIRMYDLSEEVFNVFEKNKIMRELATKTLLDISATDKYESMVNFLSVQPNETSADHEKYRNILYKIAKENPMNTFYIYKCYLRQNLFGAIRNITIGAIRFNLSKIILEDADKKLGNPKIDNITKNKIFTLLKRCIGMPNVDEILIRRGIIVSDSDELIEIVLNENKSDKNRCNALVELSKNKDISNEKLEKITATVLNSSEVINVAICSAKVQRGDNRYVVKLFDYIVNRDENSDVSIEAMNQVKRLKGLEREDLNGQLKKVAEQILSNEEDINIKKGMKIIELFSSGIPSNDIAEIFLDKLKNTNHLIVKNRILDFFKKEFNRFNENMKEQINTEIINCSYDKETSDKAMECLISINSFKDLTPIGGGE